jgi:transcriptional regulator
MYTPEHFKETDTERLEALIRGYPFGTLITVNDGFPLVNHLPILLERRTSDTAFLLGHVARANPQWHHLASGQTALAVFQGPHAYVSPSWYGSPGVPTWNYAVVHVYGKARILENDAEAEDLLERLTAIYEANQPAPWKANLAGERRAKLLGMIVGFEIRISAIEGKFKLNQNRPVEDQRAVVERLMESRAPLGVAVAKLMKHNLKDEF